MGGRLIVDDRNDACRPRAERILRAGVRITARGQSIDVGGRTVRCALDLVEPPVVLAEQSPHRAMRGDAWRTARSIDVTSLRRLARRARGHCQHREANGDHTLPVAMAHRTSLEIHFHFHFLRFRFRGFGRGVFRGLERGVGTV